MPLTANAALLLRREDLYKFANQGSKQVYNKPLEDLLILIEELGVMLEEGVLAGLVLVGIGHEVVNGQNADQVRSKHKNLIEFCETILNNQANTK
jgi:hypothetical protein